MDSQYGPPGRPEMDRRMEFLRDNMRDSGVELPREPTLQESLLPLIFAQAGDLVSTSNLLGLNGRPSATGGVMSTVEHNPLPGMGSNLGRLGWGGIESLAVAAILKAKPALGRKIASALGGVHGGLASGNNQTYLSTLTTGTPMDGLVSVR